jgi:hypothetical protein
MSGTGSTTLNNKYKPGGGGVGASSVAIRRAKNRLSTVCTSENKCGAFYNRLGLYARNPNGYVNTSKPSAPILNTITPSTGQLTLNFTLGSDGGSAITDIEYSTNNGATWTSSNKTTSPFTVTGLANGTTYQVKVRAKNSVGTGPASNMVSGTTRQIITYSAVPTTTTWVAPAGVTTVEYLVVGGGGGSGGGYNNSGGGGGGGGMVLTGTLSVTPGTSYNVIVGDGGEGGISIREQPPLIPAASETNGTAGINSVFGSITSLGGGGGYASRQAPGGSGLGGIKVSGSAVASTGGNGGGGGGSGGGGGGNASNGNNGSNNVGPDTGGNGGAGVANSISGSPVTYGAGGDGANSGGLNVSVAGAANTGNGARAGGVASTAQTPGAKGGSGIVIIKF